MPSIASTIGADEHRGLRAKYADTGRNLRVPATRAGKIVADVDPAIFWQLARLALDCCLMSHPVRIAHLPFAVAAVFIAFGSVVADLAAAADESKGAQCAALRDPVARLACFDAAFPAPRTSSPATAAAAVAADEPESEARQSSLSSTQNAALEAKSAEPALAATTVAVAADEPVSEARKSGLSGGQGAELEAISAEPALAATTTAVAADEPLSEAEKFGLSSRQRAELEAKSGEPPLAAMTAAVKTVRRLPPGYLLIGLDNDQVWRQTEIDPLVRLRPGDQVTIRQASLGSYLLVTPGLYSTRVRRLQ